MDGARKSCDGRLFAFLEQAGEQIRFAVTQPKPGGHRSLTERRDGDAGDIDGGAH